ncbi:MAG: UDP-N-acetylmuramoyl-L-alanyl-D-glutamate--2,6-diaminopimelate ligase [Lautropia sp. SCN 66-9]|nr:MAG: UDP-N-acetylmuramoyl-L-alanyl-D-glutamate--2,6-diaminopimelate ligase [Lautropia sp. SCN 66-9]
MATTAAHWLRSVLAPGAGLTADSRELRPGDAFIAYPGEKTDGRAFIAQALANGAAAVLYEASEEGDGQTAVDANDLHARGVQTGGVPSHAVPGLKRLAGPIAAEYYEHPSARLDVIAVTGTNGKTSITQWIARGLADAGKRSAVIGTLGSGIVSAGSAYDELESFGLTTPDAVSLQRMFAQFVAAGVEVVAMEASSIGLDQGRIDGSTLKTAIFTNLSRDHLDYHGDEQSYFAAKQRLFHWPGLRIAIVNGDDPLAPDILDRLPQGIQTISFGHLPGEYGWRAKKKLSAFQIHEDKSGTRATIGGDYGRAEIRLQLIGRFNAVNATAVASTWISQGMPFDEAMRRLEALQPIPGRMQQVEVPERPLAVIDYAHTPDALMSVLQALRPIAEVRGGQLWCVFGAGGERDAGKRPIMGIVAERFADKVAVTSDNPRGETPFRIVSDIRAGFTREPWLTELDRGEAIRQTLAAADASDVVLIAGKGHETYQEIDGVRHPFSDLQLARQLLGVATEESSV